MLVVILIQSCEWGMTETQREFYSRPPHHLTDKEKKFKADLAKLGYTEIELVSPNDLTGGKNSQSCFLELKCPFELNSNNTDSIQKISDSLADVLYSKVLFDSVIYVCNEIVISFIANNLSSTFILPSDFNAARIDKACF